MRVRAGAGLAAGGGVGVGVGGMIATVGGGRARTVGIVEGHRSISSPFASLSSTEDEEDERERVFAVSVASCGRGLGLHCPRLELRGCGLGLGLRDCDFLRCFFVYALGGTVRYCEIDLCRDIGWDWDEVAGETLSSLVLEEEFRRRRNNARSRSRLSVASISVTLFSSNTGGDTV
ncbi:hypothetical protein F5Y01DRAFT_294427 [Xylaria sp. FL0043]|nr:hypothetical protein F5Y01DRAFT_294427 [Xylaria sp. FL0043]